MFLFTYSDVDCDMAVYIVQEEESISAVGYVSILFRFIASNNSQTYQLFGVCIVIAYGS